MNAVSAAVGAIVTLSDSLDMNLRLRYGLDFYEFSEGDGFGGGEPWDTIHTATAAAIFTYQAADDFKVFGGPVFQSSRESGADFGDSISVGATLGVTYEFTQEFQAGFGLGVVSEIEDDITLYPIFILNWHIANDLRVDTRAGAGTFGLAGAELIYTGVGGWEFAFGGAYYKSRFRLDDDTPEPDGVGETSAIPFWLRATWLVTDRASVDFILGGNTFGTIRLESDDGDGVEDEDYDMASFLGVYGHLRF